MIVPTTNLQNKKNDAENNEFFDELNQKIKENRAEVHEINTSVSTPFEKMSDESFYAICNPSVAAFKEGISELNRLLDNDNSKNNVKAQLEVIDQIHMILLMGNEQLNLKIIEMLPELYIFLRYPDLYDKICTVLSDISHMNVNVINSLLNYNIFEKLDYSRNISFSLIFNICDQNKDCWQKFESFLKLEFRQNKYMQMLIEQYK